MICLDHDTSAIDVLMRLATSKNNCQHFGFNWGIPCFNVSKHSGGITHRFVVL